MLNRLRAAAIGAFAVLAMGSAFAQTAADAPPGTPTTTVFTRARVVSFLQEADRKFYVRLKLLPRAKLPFTTQTFRVVDRSLLTDIPDGASVKFTSRHIDGENVLTAIHTVTE